MDSTHTAFAELVDDLIVADGFADHGIICLALGASTLRTS